MTARRSSTRTPGRRVSYANVMSTVAVVLALTTSSAYAAGLAKNSVRSKHIVANAIKAKHIASNAVQGTDISSGAVGAKAIEDGSVGADELGAGSVGTSELANSSVIDSKIATNGVGTSEIKQGSIKREDIEDEAVSSAQMSPGVNRLLFDAGTVPVNRSFGDVSVSNSSWPGGAPSSGAQLSATWTQPASSLDVVSGFARVQYPVGCTASSAGGRGLDVKIVNQEGRVISASSAEFTDGSGYNGNGFWAEQAALPGVTFRPPSSVDLANDPEAFVDYIHLPFELSETVTGSSSVNREVHVFLKRSSSACTPVVTDARIIVYRYADL